MDRNTLNKALYGTDHMATWSDAFDKMTKFCEKNKKALFGKHCDIKNGFEYHIDGIAFGYIRVKNTNEAFRFDDVRTLILEFLGENTELTLNEYILELKRYAKSSGNGSKNIYYSSDDEGNNFNTYFFKPSLNEDRVCIN